MHLWVRENPLNHRDQSKRDSTAIVGERFLFVRTTGRWNSLYMRRVVMTLYGDQSEDVCKKVY